MSRDGRGRRSRSSRRGFWEWGKGRVALGEVAPAPELDVRGQQHTHRLISICKTTLGHDSDSGEPMSLGVDRREMAGCDGFGARGEKKRASRVEASFLVVVQIDPLASGPAPYLRGLPEPRAPVRIRAALARRLRADPKRMAAEKLKIDDELMRA